MNNPFVTTLMQNDQELLRKYAKIIALSVRNEIEDFHVKHLTDAQMKELNPLIRNAVYDILFILANFEKSKQCAEILGWTISCIPSYWEEPELNKDLQKIHDDIMHPAIVFESDFLNQQLEVGNMQYIPSMAIVQLAFSIEFTGIKDIDRKRHKNKIVNALKKEGYIYSYSLDGYKKGFLK